MSEAQSKCFLFIVLFGVLVFVFLIGVKQIQSPKSMAVFLYKMLPQCNNAKGLKTNKKITQANKVKKAPCNHNLYIAKLFLSTRCKNYM